MDRITELERLVSAYVDYTRYYIFNDAEKNSRRMQVPLDQATGAMVCFKRLEAELQKGFDRRKPEKRLGGTEIQRLENKAKEIAKIYPDASAINMHYSGGVLTVYPDSVK